MIYLASASPRRRELLRQLGVRFEAVAPDVVEALHDGESAFDYVLRLANAKSRRGAELAHARGWAARPVLGADTEVVLDGEILGKPADRAHALDMLGRLSGRTHQVLTAISLLHQDEISAAVSDNRVTFASLLSSDIDRYWDTGEPVDKAGGYAIQGAGAAFIARIEGSYSGIVGLPLYELAQLLKRVASDE
jgi:nucleoside triphosphate pyrophosphatase